MDEMLCFSILKVKHFWFSFWNYFPFIFFIILCAINMTQNQGKLRHDVSVCWKGTALNYLKGYYFFNFHCRELWHLLELLCLAQFQNPPGNRIFVLLRTHEGMMSATLLLMSHGAAVLRNNTAKVKISNQRGARPGQEGKRHGPKMSSHL